MNLIKKIEYQALDREGLQALYLVREAFLNENAGVRLTNKCLRQILPKCSSRVSRKGVVEFAKRVSHIFPHYEVALGNDVHGNRELILKATNKADSDKADPDYKKIDSVPDEAEIMKQLGFRDRKMTLELKLNKE